jgi:hypothetical protein
VKKVYVLMRILALKDETTVRFPVGVFTDKEDALRAADQFTRSISTMNQQAASLLQFIGIKGFSGVVVEQDFVAGAGLEVVDRPALIFPSG